MNDFLKLQPKDTQMKPCADGSEINVFWITSTGGWDAIVLPVDVECKAVKVNVHDGAATFGHQDSPAEFHYSGDSAGTAWDWASTGAVFGIGKKTGTLLYVRAVAGLKIAVTTLA